MAQFHFDPKTYESLIAEEVPAYDRLQDEVAEASRGGSPARILDLGTGTGVTAQRVLAIHPKARLVGIDASQDMLAAARDVLPAETELRVGRLEEPLPPGPFELVVSALAVHHLDGLDKRDLFSRIAALLAPNGRFVLADVVIPDDPADAVTPIEGEYDKPSTVADQLTWLHEVGFVPSVTWSDRDVAVLTADLS